MRHIWSGIVLAMAFLAATTFDASADSSDCQLVAFSKLPMTFGIDGRVNVPVLINGQTERLLVDTGALVSMVNLSTAKLPGMRIFGSGRLSIEIYGGLKSNGFVFVQNSTFGDMSPGYHPFFIVPDNALPDVSGLLGADVLKNFDVEFDFANSQLMIFSQNHCPGRVVY